MQKLNHFFTAGRSGRRAKIFDQAAAPAPDIASMAKSRDLNNSFVGVSLSKVRLQKLCVPPGNLRFDYIAFSP